RVHRSARDETQVLRGVGILAQLAEAAGQLRRGDQRRHAVAADESRDRRVIDARLLGELALRHLLGLELGSKPFVERSAVRGRHRVGSELRARGRVTFRSAPTIGSGPGTLYHPFVPDGGTTRSAAEGG